MVNQPVMTLEVLFEIPTEVAPALAAGEFSRHGGVLRDSGGQIVVHLKEVGSKLSEANPAAARAVRTRNGKVVGGVLLTVLVAGSGVMLWHSWKKHAETKRVIARVNRYNQALVPYLAAIQNQSLDGDLVDELVSALDDLVLMDERLDDRVDVKGTVLPELLTFVVEYTKALAEANSVSPPEFELVAESEPEDTVVLMRTCLVAQREILDRAA